MSKSSCVVSQTNDVGNGYAYCRGSVTQFVQVEVKNLHWKKSRKPADDIVKINFDTTDAVSISYCERSETVRRWNVTSETEPAGKGALIAVRVKCVVSCSTVSQEDCTWMLSVHELTGGYKETTHSPWGTRGLAEIYAHYNYGDRDIKLKSIFLWQNWTYTCISKWSGK
jgi:hypothetical protein